MMNFISALHILVALALIGLVLLQDSKGGGALGIGGGGSNSLLGATGAQTLAAKLTRIVAIIFALTCIGLTVLTVRQTRSVIDNTVLPPAPATAPAEAQAPAESAPTAPAQQTQPPASTPENK